VFTTQGSDSDTILETSTMYKEQWPHYDCIDYYKFFDFASSFCSQLLDLLTIQMSVHVTVVDCCWQTQAGWNEGSSCDRFSGWSTRFLPGSHAN